MTYLDCPDCPWCGIETLADTPWGPVTTVDHDLCEAEFFASIPDVEEVPA